MNIRTMEHQRQALLDKIERLSLQQPVDERAVQKLKNEYNQVITRTRNQHYGLPCDILDIFPPEVWARMIDFAMPSYEDDEALLELTLVSDKWRHALVSTPVLWSRIHINGRDQDSLAKIMTFIALSRTVAVSIFISAPPLHDHETLRDLVASIGPRLREVVITPNYGAFPRYRFPRQQVVSVFDQLFFDMSDLVTEVTRVHLEDDSEEYMYKELWRQAENTPLAPKLDAIHGGECDQASFQLLQDRFERLEGLDSWMPIQNILVNNLFVPEAQLLQIANAVHRVPTEIRRVGLPRLGNLTSLTYGSGYPDALVSLLDLVAPQLVQLVLKVPSSRLDTLKVGLTTASKLRRLLLMVDHQLPEDAEREGRSSRLDWGPIVPISTLRYLNVWVIRPLSDEVQQTLRTLILRFIEMYRNVKDAYFSLKDPEGFIEAVLRHLSTHSGIQSLSLNGYILRSSSLPPKVTLKHVERLRISDINLLSWLEVPTLCSLEYVWTSDMNENSISRNTNVRKLSVTRNQDSLSCDIHLPVKSFPFLTHLRTTFARSSINGSWTDTFSVGSFLYLSSISIYIRGALDLCPYPTMFCYQLLCEPDCCPSLEEVHFFGYPPEWDILLIMLERRNFLTTSAVSRIKRLRLPFITEELCDPVVSLLRGMFVNRPSNNELVLGGAPLSLLDENLSGCYVCLVNMMSPCDFKVAAKSEWQPHDGKKLRSFLGWHGPSPSTAREALEWIGVRQSLIQDFLSELESWGNMYTRKMSCYKTRQAFQISEHGVYESW
ncbi:hypothetical protein M408DRAFT_169099 [Serendipita vermifera MAFF 305830]|uniref:F-box domain-containing protein n=1 Tax=Serendipita vermifera MAFF 305830 TaxID=933852 RepID=A0A0C3B778_SERVB|nr:hypothetical protein M408DRAFT_169099 [Serendipita vermifera MAFF 305830]